MPQTQTRELAIENLKRHLQPGDTVYTITRHISSSGMTWHVSAVIFTKESHAALHPNPAISMITGYKLHDNGPRYVIVMRGCGYGHGATLVSDLAYELFGKDNALEHEEL